MTIGIGEAYGSGDHKVTEGIHRQASVSHRNIQVQSLQTSVMDHNVARARRRKRDGADCSIESTSYSTNVQNQLVTGDGLARVLRELSRCMERYIRTAVHSSQ